MEFVNAGSTVALLCLRSLWGHSRLSWFSIWCCFSGVRISSVLQQLRCKTHPAPTETSVFLAALHSSWVSVGSLAWLLHLLKIQVSKQCTHITMRWIYTVEWSQIIYFCEGVSVPAKASRSFLTSAFSSGDTTPPTLTRRMAVRPLHLQCRKFHCIVKRTKSWQDSALLLCGSLKPGETVSSDFGSGMRECGSITINPKGNIID